MVGADRKEGSDVEDDLKVVAVPRKGRGIVAGRRFAEGEVIERAPVLVIPAADWRLVQDTVVSKYCFSWGRELKDAALALGRCSLFNHSYKANAYAQPYAKERVMEFLAFRDIDEGEEITINYNGEPDAVGAVGFRVHDP
jgi:SET domain-containing protein